MSATISHNDDSEKNEPSGSLHDPGSVAFLARELKKREITLSKSKIDRLSKYCELLWFWNEKINLTRHTDFGKFVARDLVDSMVLSEFLLEEERVLDVGTGGGVPGVLLAILRPDLRVELCDSTAKKARAVGEIVKALRLDVPVWSEKAEDIFPSRRYTSLLVRAVSKMPRLLRLFSPHWHSFERILMLKGPNWVAERGECRHFGLMNNLALRVLKSYPMSPPETPEEFSPPNAEILGITEEKPANEAQKDPVESVLLQLCQKAKFEALSEHITQRIQSRDFTRRKKEDRVRKPRR